MGRSSRVENTLHSVYVGLNVQITVSLVFGQISGAQGAASGPTLAPSPTLTCRHVALSRQGARLVEAGLACLELELLCHRCICRPKPGKIEPTIFHLILSVPLVTTSCYFPAAQNTLYSCSRVLRRYEEGQDL